ncbi:uncharacterized protein BCR38DRAFT_112900 [Pseudomassariella vexata]|uniref:Uncharacterized protein n=1 Tax=Pseudomassariella vexata TaxID=1141098 RepID=A0A1Y2DCU1_9PEZI|nr:uncharacterized protein BCR38DRAFT_112900 [Pseudomassariella vexata]ORY56944.1 hypothetical protein BCR38DRAFT_112900 [Pseudomassariella vexata]
MHTMFTHSLRESTLFIPHFPLCQLQYKLCPRPASSISVIQFTSSPDLDNYLNIIIFNLSIALASSTSPSAPETPPAHRKCRRDRASCTTHCTSGSRNKELLKTLALKNLINKQLYQLATHCETTKKGPVEKKNGRHGQLVSVTVPINQHSMPMAKRFSIIHHFSKTFCDFTTNTTQSSRGGVGIFPSASLTIPLKYSAISLNLFTTSSPRLFTAPASLSTIMLSPSKLTTPTLSTFLSRSASSILFLLPPLSLHLESSVYTTSFHPLSSILLHILSKPLLFNPVISTPPMGRRSIPPSGGSIQ